MKRHLAVLLFSTLAMASENNCPFTCGVGATSTLVGSGVSVSKVFKSKPMAGPNAEHEEISETFPFTEGLNIKFYASCHKGGSTWISFGTNTNDLPTYQSKATVTNKEVYGLSSFDPHNPVIKNISVECRLN